MRHENYRQFEFELSKVWSFSREFHAFARGWRATAAALSLSGISTHKKSLAVLIAVKF